MVDVYESSWQAAGNRKNGWHAVAACHASGCGTCDPNRYGHACGSGVAVDLPVDPEEISVPAYEAQQQSDAWRQSAAVLPRTNGVYSDQVSKDYSNKHFEAILFTEWGTVFVFDVEVASGLFAPVPFREGARRAMQWFGHPSPREERRGLYGLNGLAISFTVRDMYGNPAEYTGAIDASSKELKLQVVPIGHTGRRPLKRTYKFQRV
jgi:hypothetical protein